jgi:hypothetical protein
MIYTYEDNHSIIDAIKKKGWVIFEVYGNRVTKNSDIYDGWWIDCAVAYGTKHFKTHKEINNKYLGNTLKDSLKTVNSEKFPFNVL